MDKQIHRKVVKGDDTLGCIMKLLGLYSSIVKADNHVELEGIKASSYDYNQSIYRTLDRRSLDFFWSSAGSSNEED